MLQSAEVEKSSTELKSYNAQCDKHKKDSEEAIKHMKELEEQLIHAESKLSRKAEGVFLDTGSSQQMLQSLVLLATSGGQKVGVLEYRVPGMICRY